MSTDETTSQPASTDRVPGYYWALPSQYDFNDQEWAPGEWRVVQWNPSLEWPVRIGGVEGYKESVIAKWGARIHGPDEVSPTRHVLALARPFVKAEAQARRDEGQNNDAMQVLMQIDEVLGG